MAIRQNTASKLTARIAEIVKALPYYGKASLMDQVALRKSAEHLIEGGEKIDALPDLMKFATAEECLREMASAWVTNDGRVKQTECPAYLKPYAERFAATLRKPAKPANVTAKTIAQETSPKAAATAKATQPKSPAVPAKLPNEIPQPKTTPCKVTVKDEKGRTSSAGHPCPMPEDVRQKNKSEKTAAVKPLVKADEKSIREHRLENLLQGKTPITAKSIDGLNASELTLIAKAKGYKGYSGLKKDELVSFLVKGGVKPNATPNSTRGLKETASALKKAGLIVGAVSAASKSTLEKAVAAAKSGKVVTITKAEPKEGTADDLRNRLKTAGQYDTRFTAKSREMFKTADGKGRTISTLKKDELVALVAAVGV